MDNHHVQIRPLSCSCAGLELSNLSSSPEKIAYQLATYLYHPARGIPAGFVIWSDIDLFKELMDTPGERLAVFLHKLFPEANDSLSTLCEIENPKTGNHVIVYTWAICHEKFKAWWIAERVKKVQRV